MRPPITEEYEAWKDEVVAKWRQGITRSWSSPALVWSWCAFVGVSGEPFDVRSTRADVSHSRESVPLTDEQEARLLHVLEGKRYRHWKAGPELVGLLIHAKDGAGGWRICFNRAPTDAPPEVRRLPLPVFAAEALTFLTGVSVPAVEPSAHYAVRTNSRGDLEGGFVFGEAFGRVAELRAALAERIDSTESVTRTAWGLDAMAYPDGKVVFGVSGGDKGPRRPSLPYSQVVKGALDLLD